MMARYGMLIDTGKCVGCMTCASACQVHNNLPEHLSFIRYEHVETGSKGTFRRETVPLQCMHCEDAPCASVCPTGAAFIGPDGLVGVDSGRCIGCKYCIAACPYRVRSVNEETGTVDKCRLCAAAANNGSRGCSCVDACPTGARIAGDLDDPESPIARAVAQTHARPIAGTLTASKLLYAR